MVETILQLSKKYHGNWDKIYQAISLKEKVDSSQENITNSNNYIFITDNDYPDKLKDIFVPPFFLFYDGNKNLINTNVVSINGKINMLKINDFLNNEHFKNDTICFNYHETDKRIIKAVLEAKRKLILVAEGGINKVDVQINDSENILVISEYNDTNSYDKSNSQTIERLIFAFSNTILIDNYPLLSARDLLSNLINVKKPVYCLEKYRNKMTFLKLNDFKINYINSFKDIK